MASAAMPCQVAEYAEAMGIINKDAGSVYRYMNFDQIEEYAETAKAAAAAC